MMNLIGDYYKLLVGTTRKYKQLITITTWNKVQTMHADISIMKELSTHQKYQVAH